MTKRYKLLKDYLSFIGVIPAGEIIESSGGNNYYFTGEYKKMGVQDTLVENTPDWFQEIKEPERIEVRFQKVGDFDFNPIGHTAFIPIQFEKKIPAVKQAIENVLNEEGNTTMGDMRKHFNLPKYTQEQLNEEIGKAFYAGRYGPKSKSFQDYLSSL